MNLSKTVKTSAETHILMQIILLNQRFSTGGSQNFAFGSTKPEFKLYVGRQISFLL